MEQEQTQQTDTFINALERAELDTRSDPASAERKAQLPQSESEEPSPKADLLDAIQSDQTSADSQKSEFDRLREKHAQAEAPKEEKQKEEKAEAPELPESLANADPDKVAEAMAKYELTPEDLAADPRLAALVEKELAEAEAQEAQQQPQFQQTPQQQFVAHLQDLHTRAQQINDPAVMEAVANAIAPYFEASTPEAMQNIRGLTSVLGEAGVNLIDTYVPQVMGKYFQAMVDFYMPGLHQMYSDAQNENLWDSIRGDDKDLPEYGTNAFNEARDKVKAECPWIMKIQDGQAQAETFAKILKGAKYGPDGIKEALDNGIKIGERKGERQRKISSHGTRMGSGRSAASSGQPFTAPRHDEFRDAILAHNASLLSGERK